MKIDAIEQARGSLKSSIKLFEGLLEKLKSNDKQEIAQAMFTAWCLDNYIYTKLTQEVIAAIKEKMDEVEIH